MPAAIALSGASPRSLSTAGLVVLLAIANPAAAETLLEAYALARASDPKLRAAQYEAQAVGTQHEQALSAFFPTVRFENNEIGTRQRVLSSNNPIFGAGFSQFRTDSWTLSLSQPVFKFDVIERYRQVKSVLRQAHFTLLAAEQDLMLRATTAYLGVLAANDGLVLARAERTAVGRGLELARERLARGLGTITNLHDATARFAVTQAREIEAENKLSDAKQALKEITGKLIESYQTLRTEFTAVTPEPPDLERWVEGAYAQNLVLQARAEAVEVARQEIMRQRAGHFPSLNLLVNRNRRDAGSTLFGGGSSVETTEVTLQLAVPIFQGGYVNAVTDEAAFRYQKSMEERELERRGVERQTRAAFQGSISGKNLVEALTQSVRSQESALDAKSEGFKAGMLPLLPVLDAQRDLYIAKRDYAQARYDYLVNSLKLKQAAGTLSESDLLRIGAALQ
jgi:outer membrane protein